MSRISRWVSLGLLCSPISGSTAFAQSTFGSITGTVTDPAALQASDYDLREDPAAPGTWRLTRLSDGRATTVVDGDVVEAALAVAAELCIEFCVICGFTASSLAPRVLRWLGYGPNNQT